MILLSVTGSSVISQPNDSCLVLCGSEKAVLAQALNELDFRREQADSLSGIIHDQENLINNKQNEISFLNKVIQAKEDIIKKIENTPVPREVIEIGWKWYQITGAILVTGLLGFSVGKWIAK